MLIPKHIPGRQLSDADLFGRYCGRDQGANPPSSYYENISEMAAWIRSLSWHYPQDTEDAELLAKRIVGFFSAYVRSIRLAHLRRPWWWLPYRMQFGRWPWQPEEIERHATK
jgi:hypothetical protein